jgi:signal transduction histidine kinase
MDSVSQAIVGDALACAARQLATVNSNLKRLALIRKAVSLLLITGADARAACTFDQPPRQHLTADSELTQIRRQNQGAQAWSLSDRDVDMTRPDENCKPVSGHTSASPGQTQEFQDLELSFLGSLVPGIIHNMATPLSGVLGATQLLEKRGAAISEIVSDTQGMGEAERTELIKQLDRNRANVDILSRNARHLADILHCLVQRINRGSSSLKEYHSLNELLQNELLFLDANLNFKHKVKKQLSLGTEVRTAKYVYGQVAATIDEFVSSSLAAHDFKRGVMEMDFRTGPADSRMALWIEVRGASAVPAAEECATLYSCLDILRADGWAVELESNDGVRRLRLLCPRETAPA